jgi:hypothetical protein
MKNYKILFFAIILCSFVKIAIAQDEIKEKAISTTKEFKKILPVNVKFRAKNSNKDTKKEVSYSAILVIDSQARYIANYKAESQANSSLGVLTIFDGTKTHHADGFEFDSNKGKLVPTSDAQNDMILNGDEGLLPHPLNFSYMVEKDWLDVVLPDAQFEKISSDDKFGKIYFFKTTVKNDAVEIGISPDYGYSAVSYNIISKSGMRYDYKCLEMMKYKDFFVPSKSLRTVSFRSYVENEYSCETVSIGALNSKELNFDFKYKKGSIISDYETSKVFIIGKNGERIFYMGLGKNRSKDLPPYVGWIFLVSISCLTCLIVGVFIKWKSRKK